MLPLFFLVDLLKRFSFRNNIFAITLVYLITAGTAVLGAIQGVVARFDADAAPVAAERNCQKNLEARPGPPPASIGLSAF